MIVNHNLPDIDSYLRLRKAAGLPEREALTAELAISRSLFSVTIAGEDSELIGMGRIVGDGAYQFSVVDLVFHPDYKNIAIVKAVMDELTSYLDRYAHVGSEVILMSDVPSIGLYQKHGFQYTYPNAISLSRKTSEVTGQQTDNH